MSLLETLLAKIVHEKVEAGSKESIESSIDWKLIIAVGQTIRQWSFCFTSGTWALNKKLITEFYWTNYKINFAKGKSFFRTCGVVMSRWFLLNLFGWNKWCLTIWNIKVFVIAGHKNYDFLMKFWFVNFSIFLCVTFPMRNLSNFSEFDRNLQIFWFLIILDESVNI